MTTPAHLRTKQRGIKGTVAETKALFAGRFADSQPRILRVVTLVAGAGNRGVYGGPGPVYVRGTVGVVLMHVRDDPATPSGFGALVSWNGQGGKDQPQNFLIGPFPSVGAAAAAYDEHVQRFHKADGVRRRNFNEDGTPAAHITLHTGIVYSKHARDAGRPWSAEPVVGPNEKRLEESRRQRRDNHFEDADDAAEHYNYRMDKHGLCAERNFGRPCNCGPKRAGEPACPFRGPGGAGSVVKGGGEGGNGGQGGGKGRGGGGSAGRSGGGSRGKRRRGEEDGEEDGKDDDEEGGTGGGNGGNGGGKVGARDAGSRGGKRHGKRGGKRHGRRGGKHGGPSQTGQAGQALPDDAATCAQCSLLGGASGGLCNRHSVSQRPSSPATSSEEDASSSDGMALWSAALLGLGAIGRRRRRQP